MKHNKQQIIDKAQGVLNNTGFSSGDYMVSLQGPTLIFTEDGEPKLTNDIRKSLAETGIDIL